MRVAQADITLQIFLVGEAGCSLPGGGGGDRALRPDPHLPQKGLN